MVVHRMYSRKCAAGGVVADSLGHGFCCTTICNDINESQQNTADPFRQLRGSAPSVQGVGCGAVENGRGAGGGGEVAAGAFSPWEEPGRSGGVHVGGGGLFRHVADFAAGQLHRQSGSAGRKVPGVLDEGQGPAARKAGGTNDGGICGSVRSSGARRGLARLEDASGPAWPPRSRFWTSSSG